MAGKSNKGRNRRVAHNAANSSDAVVPTDAPVKDNSSASEPIKADANGVSTVEESTEAKPEAKESETENSTGQPKQGEFGTMGLHIFLPLVNTSSQYAIPIFTLSRSLILFNTTINLGLVCE